jgi:hypothetical protein
MRTRNVKVEGLEICVERRSGRNLWQQLHRRTEEKPVIMMTLGLAFPNMMSHWSPLCVSSISYVFHISHISNVFHISRLYSVVVLLLFYLISLQGFDFHQFLNFTFPYHIVMVLGSTHHSLEWWPYSENAWGHIMVGWKNGWLEEWMDGCIDRSQ